MVGVIDLSIIDFLYIVQNKPSSILGHIYKAPQGKTDVKGKLLH